MEKRFLCLIIVSLFLTGCMNKEVMEERFNDRQIESAICDAPPGSYDFKNTGTEWVSFKFGNKKYLIDTNNVHSNEIIEDTRE